MKMLSLSEELKGNSYPGRGIVIGRSEDGTKAVTAYFIMGRSVNSRNHLIHPSLRIQALSFTHRFGFLAIGRS